MPSNRTILERRSNRFQYNYNIVHAAYECRLPVAYLWFWIAMEKLKARKWLGQYWVKLYDVKALAKNLLEREHARAATWLEVNEAVTHIPVHSP
jgi:hypothetical protein